MFRQELRHASAAALALVAVMTAGCNQPARRNDWRSPSNTDPSRRPAPPTTCTTDADCAAAHGVCTIEVGAAEGTCSTSPGLVPPAHGNGAPGTPPNPPVAPNVQPSPSDIHL